MSFSERRERVTQKIEEERLRKIRETEKAEAEKVRLAEVARQRASEEQARIRIEIENDPRWKEMVKKAYDPQFKEAMEVFFLALVPKVQGERIRYSREYTQVPGIPFKHYVIADYRRQENQPVGSLYAYTSFIDQRTRTHEQIEFCVRITWREQPTTEVISYRDIGPTRFHPYGRREKEISGLNREAGMSFEVPIETEDDSRPPQPTPTSFFYEHSLREGKFFYTLDDLLDFMALQIDNHEKGLPAQLATSRISSKYLASKDYRDD